MISFISSEFIFDETSNTVSPKHNWVGCEKPTTGKILRLLDNISSFISFDFSAQIKQMLLNEINKK